MNMKNILLFLLTLSASTLVSANDFSFGVKTYKEAEKSANFVRFDMQSTKLGMLTTGFTGFVKDFNVSAEPSEEGFKNARITFQTQALDTDVNARNEKMWELCFDYKKHPQITLTLDGTVPLTGAQATLQGTLNVRGESKPVSVTIKSVEVNGQYIVDGESTLDIFEMGLPDPSIFVAKVDPKVRLKFHLAVPK
jgi:polyisoprenoid-binding protein YceI